MSKGPVRPSTLDGIKRYARKLKKDLGVTHAQALDRAASTAGFQNYIHARRCIESGVKGPLLYQVFISVPWRDRDAKTTGREILTVGLKTPLLELVRPSHLKAARHFATFKFAAEDHLASELAAGSQSRARKEACAAARTLAFMEATGLRPSSSRRRAYPHGDFDKAVPGHDHSSVWYHPVTKAHVFVDEPYSTRMQGISKDRLAWADRYGWDIVHPLRGGMYSPDGGCDLFLIADRTKSLDLAAACEALNAQPQPLVEANWNGRSEPLLPGFTSPAAKLEVSSTPKPSVERKPNMTVTYRPPFARNERRRPARRMPIEGHAEVARLLKAVISANRKGTRIVKPLDKARSELDDWVQFEYSRTELSYATFFALYYGEPEHDEQNATNAMQIERLDEVKGLLARHYPDCAPLRAVLKMIDRSAIALKS